VRVITHRLYFLKNIHYFTNTVEVPQQCNIFSISLFLYSSTQFIYITLSFINLSAGTSISKVLTEYFRKYTKKFTKIYQTYKFVKLAKFTKFVKLAIEDNSKLTPNKYKF
jgi:hypothetical protein